MPELARHSVEEDLTQVHIDMLSGLVDGFDATQQVTTDQLRRLVNVAYNYGFGDRQDHPSQAEYQLIEAGKPWEVEAKANIADNARAIVFSGQVHRRLSEDEIDYLIENYGVGNLRFEYDMVRLIATSCDGFIPLEQDEVLPFSYQVAEGNSFMEQPSGQLKKIGQIGDQDVLIIRIDSETFIDAEKKPASRFTPDSVALLGFISEVLTNYLDTTSSLALVSTTDHPASWTQVDRASLIYDRKFDISTVGGDVLEALGSDRLGDLTIESVLAEIARVRDELIKLKAEKQALVHS
ncbi:MAG TPA: hypothetical protein VIH90_01940 [Candidatus Saccharimonadales bacterium]